MVPAILSSFYAKVMYHIVAMVLIKNTSINLCGFIHFPFKWESSETSFGWVSEHKESWKKLKVVQIEINKLASQSGMKS